MWEIVKEEAMASIQAIIDNMPDNIKQEVIDLFYNKMNIPITDIDSNIRNAAESYQIYLTNRNSLSIPNLEETQKLGYLIIMASSIKTMLENIQKYRTPASSSGTGGGRSKKQRGGTLEQVYNAQGLVTDLATYNDQIVGNTNAPPPFSAGTSSSSITFEMLPKNMVDGLTPPLSAGGATTRRRTSSVSKKKK